MNDHHDAIDQGNREIRCGFVAVVGRPNAGKSTLVNAIVGHKVSIVTHKAQTTRHRILGIKSDTRYQLILVDTPGFHLEARQTINKMMNKAALSALYDVDAVIFVIEACKWHGEEDNLLQRLKQIKAPVVAVINKTDLIEDKERLLPFIAELSEKYSFQSIMPLSAKTCEGLPALENEIVKQLPLGKPLYEFDDITDKSMRFQAAELIREQLYLKLKQELPYAVTVEIEAFEESQELCRIAAVIWVARENHKGIVIGKNGASLKSIAKNSRLSMQSAFCKTVYLDVWVKVKTGWNDDERALRKLGYQDG